MNQNFQFRSYTPGKECHTVGTHINFHDEEAASYAELSFYGDEIHPGITNAIEQKKFLFVPAGITIYEGLNWEQWEDKGVIFVGTMDSPYDEHYLPEEIRQFECSTTLVARALKLKGNGIEKMLNGLVKSDRKSEDDFLSFSSHIRRGQLYHGTSHEAQTYMLQRAIEPFQWLIASQDQFSHESANYCRKNAIVEKIRYKDFKIKVAFIQTDDPQMTTIAKTSQGVSANVVICQNSRGNVYISTSKRPFVNLAYVYRDIAITEMSIKNMKFNPRDPRLLEEGHMVGLDEWHFQKEANRIFNGSISSPEKTPTRIAPNVLMAIVLRSLQYSKKPRALSTAPGFENLKKLVFDEEKKMAS